MRRTLFEWRGITIYAYSAMFYIGLIVGVLGGTYAAARHGLDPTRVYFAMLLLIPPTMIGARLLYVALNWQDFRHEIDRIWRRSEGGTIQYGGFGLAMLVSLPLLHWFRLPFGAFWDAGTITLLTAMIFGRFGCFLTGCCAGRPSSSFLSLRLPNAQGIWAHRLPSQLLEAGLAVLLLLAACCVWNRLPFEGAFFLGSLMVYGVGRFWLAATRENDIRTIRLAQASSLGLSVLAAGVFLAVWIPIAGTQAADSLLHASLIANAGASVPSINSAQPYLLLAPLAVLAVLSLFHSVGCASFSGSDAVAYVDGDYPKTVLTETNGQPDTPGNRVLVANWRLQEFAPATVVPGGQAKDELGSHNGTYEIVTLPPLPDAPLDQNHSPTTAQPGKLTLGAPGLLGITPPMGSNKSIEVDGGFVTVPPSNSLNLPNFTLEALVFPTWDVTQQGRYYCVIEHSSPDANKKLGIAIYAGPESPTKLNTDYRWQVWIGVKSGGTTKFTEIKPTGSPRPLPLIEPNKVNYVTVTYDGTRLQLYATYEGKFSIKNTEIAQDQVLAVDEATTFAPNAGPVPFYIGMGRSLFTPFPLSPQPLERYPFVGRIQEVAVYNAALKWERIASHIAASLKHL